MTCALPLSEWKDHQESVTWRKVMASSCQKGFSSLPGFYPFSLGCPQELLAGLLWGWAIPSISQLSYLTGVLGF